MPIYAVVNIRPPDKHSIGPVVSDHEQTGRVYPCHFLAIEERHRRWNPIRVVKPSQVFQVLIDFIAAVHAFVTCTGYYL